MNFGAKQIALFYTFSVSFEEIRPRVTNYVNPSLQYGPRREGEVNFLNLNIDTQYKGLNMRLY
jgi:hypothetical protein